MSILCSSGSELNSLPSSVSLLASESSFASARSFWKPNVSLALIVGGIYALYKKLVIEFLLICWRTFCLRVITGYYFIGIMLFCAELCAKGRKFDPLHYPQTHKIKLEGWESLVSSCAHSISCTAAINTGSDLWRSRRSRLCYAIQVMAIPSPGNCVPGHGPGISARDGFDIEHTWVVGKYILIEGEGK